jgi:uncharacterized MnhB-related membrane protein
MTLVIVIALVAVLGGATVVVFTDDPARQAVVLGVYGLLLTVFFMVLQAPDVALSQLAVGTAVTPLMVLLAVRKVAQSKRRERDDR